MESTIKQNLAGFGFDGTSALKAEAAPRLYLIEGGRGKSAEPIADAVAKNIPFPVLCAILRVAGAVFLACAVYAMDAVRASTVANILQDAPTEQVLVASGDTVWGIASEHCPEGASTSDVVDWIRSRNSLQESNLEIGQRLTVPEPASV